MNELTYSIADEVFQRFPDYVRGVVIAYEVTNRESTPELIKMLRDAEEICKELMGLVQRFCGGRLRCDILTRQNPKIKFQRASDSPKEAV